MAASRSEWLRLASRRNCLVKLAAVKPAQWERGSGRM